MISNVLPKKVWNLFEEMSEGESLPGKNPLTNHIAKSGDKLSIAGWPGYYRIFYYNSESKPLIFGFPLSLLDMGDSMRTDYEQMLQRLRVIMKDEFGIAVSEALDVKDVVTAIPRIMKDDPLSEYKRESTAYVYGVCLGAWSRIRDILVSKALYESKLAEVGTALATALLGYTIVISTNVMQGFSDYLSVLQGAMVLIDEMGTGILQLPSEYIASEGGAEGLIGIIASVIDAIKAALPPSAGNKTDYTNGRTAIIVELVK